MEYVPLYSLHLLKNVVLLCLRYYIAVIAGGNFNNGLSDGLFAFLVDSAVGFAASDVGVCAIE